MMQDLDLIVNMPLVYFCLMCGQNVPPSSVLKNTPLGDAHIGRNGRLCGPIDMWEQDRKEDFNDVDESEENV